MIQNRYKTVTIVNDRLCGLYRCVATASSN